MEKEQVFLRLCLPPHFLGVPVSVFVFLFVAFASSILITGSIFAGIFLLPVYMAVRELLRRDPHAFQVLRVWAMTRLINRNAGYWGGSSYAPSTCIRRFDMREMY